MAFALEGALERLTGHPIGELGALRFWFVKADCSIDDPAACALNASPRATVITSHRYRPLVIPCCDLDRFMVFSSLPPGSTACRRQSTPRESRRAPAQESAHGPRAARESSALRSRPFRSC